MWLQTWTFGFLSSGTLRNCGFSVAVKDFAFIHDLYAYIIGVCWQVEACPWLVLSLDTPVPVCCWRRIIHPDHHLPEVRVGSWNMREDRAIRGGGVSQGRTACGNLTVFKQINKKTEWSKLYFHSYYPLFTKYQAPTMYQVLFEVLKI